MSWNPAVYFCLCIAFLAQTCFLAFISCSKKSNIHCKENWNVKEMPWLELNTGIFTPNCPHVRLEIQLIWFWCQKSPVVGFYKFFGCSIIDEPHSMLKANSYYSFTSVSFLMHSPIVHKCIRKRNYLLWAFNFYPELKA